MIYYRFIFFAASEFAAVFAFFENTLLAARMVTTVRALKNGGQIAVPKRGSLFVLQGCRTPLCMHVYTCVDTGKHMQPTWSNAQVITFLFTRIHIHDQKHLVFKHMRRAKFMA